MAPETKGPAGRARQGSLLILGATSVIARATAEAVETEPDQDADSRAPAQPSHEQAQTEEDQACHEGGQIIRELFDELGQRSGYFRRHLLLLP